MASFNNFAPVAAADNSAVVVAAAITVIAADVDVVAVRCC